VGRSHGELAGLVEVVRGMVLALLSEEGGGNEQPHDQEHDNQRIREEWPEIDVHICFPCCGYRGWAEAGRPDPEQKPKQASPVATASVPASNGAPIYTYDSFTSSFFRLLQAFRRLRKPG